MALFRIIVEERASTSWDGARCPPTTLTSATAKVNEPDLYRLRRPRLRHPRRRGLRAPTVCDPQAIRKRDQRFGIADAENVHFSLSSKTLVYKGMLMATQLREYFPDLSTRG
jgi:hypothetical protein